MNRSQSTGFLTDTLGNLARVMRDGAIAYVCMVWRHMAELLGAGETGRYRTNVWDYAGFSSIGADRSEELAMHPTVEPVAIVADAIRDCSRRGEIILDDFGGSASKLIVAEKTVRSARLFEYYPLYCDTIVRRWQGYTGKRAILADTGTAFEEVADERCGLELEAAQ